jgi:DNA-binding MarR family transcriptional regulator
VSETVAALSELLDSADEAIGGTKSYLVGQLAAELITSASDAELSQVIVTTHQQRGSSDGEVAPTSRESVYSMMSGLLQGVLADRQSAGTPVTPLTVRERVLNLLAIEPQNPTSLATEIGCAPATASRALGRLRHAGLVEYRPSSETADGRHVTYQLTTEGEKRQDDRFLGRLDYDPISEDDYEDDWYGYGQELAQLTQLVADLNTHDPAIAAELYPALEALKDRVDDPELRAAALGELCALSHSKPDLVSAEQSRSWVDELLALAQGDNPLIAASAHYERARWAMRYQSTDESGIEDDLATAQRYAAAAGGPDGANLNAWCLYQRATWALLRWDRTHAEPLARAASSEFDSLGDYYGRLASQIVTARAKLALGEMTAADNMLAEVVESARRLGYKRQLADGLFWRGQTKVWIDVDEAREILRAAAVLYSALGDQDWSAMARTSAETARVTAGDINAATARSVRKELEKTSAEIEKSTDIASPAHSWTAATINRRIGVLSAVAGDKGRADSAWKRAVAEFTESDSPEGIAATLVSSLLAKKSDSTEPSAVVPSGDDIRGVAERWDLSLSDRTINLAVAEASRVPSDPVGRVKHLMAYG